MRTLAIAGGFIFTMVWILLEAITAELTGSDAIIAIGGGVGFAIVAFIFGRLRKINS